MLSEIFKEIYSKGAFPYIAPVWWILACFSVNLMGGPAIPAEKFAKWKQKVLLGVSLKVIAPRDSMILKSWLIGESIAGPLSLSSVIRSNGETGYSTVMILYYKCSFLRRSATQATKEQPIGALEGHYSGLQGCSSSSATAVQELSGLKSSIFINSSRVDGPKSL
jgi:hypothetical protein